MVENRNGFVFRKKSDRKKPSKKAFKAALATNDSLDNTSSILPSSSTSPTPIPITTESKDSSTAHVISNQQTQIENGLQLNGVQPNEDNESQNRSLSTTVEEPLNVNLPSQENNRILNINQTLEEGVCHSNNTDNRNNENTNEIINGSNIDSNNTIDDNDSIYSNNNNSDKINTFNNNNNNNNNSNSNNNNNDNAYSDRENSIIDDNVHTGANCNNKEKELDEMFSDLPHTTPVKKNRANKRKSTKGRRRSTFNSRGRVRKSLAIPHYSEFHNGIPTDLPTEGKLRFLLQNCLEHGRARLERWETGDELLDDIRKDALIFCQDFCDSDVFQHLPSTCILKPNPENIENSKLLTQYMEKNKSLEKEKKIWDAPFENIRPLPESAELDIATLKSYLKPKEKDFLASKMEDFDDITSKHINMLELKIDHIHQQTKLKKQLCDVAEVYHKSRIVESTAEKELANSDMGPTPRKLIKGLANIM